MVESIFSYLVSTFITILVMYYFCVVFALVMDEYNSREDFWKDLVPFRAIYRKIKRLPNK